MWDRNTDRMMEMWVDLLNQLEQGDFNRLPQTRRRQIGTVEDRDTEIVLSADLPGVEKKDIELKVDNHSISFSAETEDRNYDFSQSFDFELDSDNVKATFVNGVLDVVVAKKEEHITRKTIEIE